MSLFRLAPVLVLGFVVASGFPVQGAPLALNLEEIVDLLSATEEPLSAGQIAALAPILEAAPPEASQRGVIVSDELREQILGILTETQNNALLRAEAGQMLLAEGVEGLKVTLAAADVPANHVRSGNTGSERLRRTRPGRLKTCSERPGGTGYRSNPRSGRSKTSCFWPHSSS